MRIRQFFFMAVLLYGLFALPTATAKPAPAPAQRPVALQQARLMATVTLFSIANTTTPGRTSATVSYSGSASALFKVLSNTWTTDNPSIVVSFAIQQSFDSGTTWQDFCSTQWNPNTFGKGGAMPAIACTAQDVSGQRLLRAVLSASSPINVGISATVT